MSAPEPGRRGWPTPPAPPDRAQLEAMLDAVRDGRIDAWLARIRVAVAVRMATDDYTHPRRPG
jgi:hypothetical protein